MICFGEPPASLELKTVAKRDGERLAIDYFLRGQIVGLRLPSPDVASERREGLWESTCFEAFISEADQDYYWELNASPAGHWNIFHFRGYRDGKKNETRIPAPRIEILAREPGLFHLRAELDLSRVLGPRALLDLGLTTVLESAGDRKTYWALAHLGDKPDFHVRKSFRVRL